MFQTFLSCQLNAFTAKVVHNSLADVDYLNDQDDYQQFAAVFDWYARLERWPN